MKIVKKNIEILSIFSLFIIVLISYINYLLFGGFGTGDDLTNILKVKNENYNLYESIKNNLLGNQASRPISLILKEIVHFFFQDNVRIYIILNILIWLLSIFFITLTLSNFINKSSYYTFFLLASFPIFSSAVIAGPYLFTSYIFCIFLWSLSIFFIINYSKNHTIFSYYLSFIFTILSLLTLEYVFPLFIISAFLPIYYELKKKKEYNNRLLIKLFFIYLFPLIVIVITFLFFKIFLINYYANTFNIYGLSKISISSILQSLYFIVVIFFEVPSLLIETIKHLLNMKLSFLLLIISIFTFLLIEIKKNDEKKFSYKENRSSNKILFIIFLISLFSNSLIFLISFYPASTFGHYNKLMLPSFISFCFLLSLLINKYINKKFSIFLIILFYFWISSMNIQLDNFVKSWELRNFIIKDISNNIKNENLNKNDIIISNIPYFLRENYNNELVTFTIWNFEAHVNLNNNINLRVYPICDRIINDKNFFPNHNITNHLNDILPNDNIYYYQFEQGEKKGHFEYLGKKNNLIKKINEIKHKGINSHSMIFREKVRTRMIYLAKHFFK